MSEADKQWGRRLKQARLAAQLSQKQLGIQAGIDEFVASTRINRYELGVHKPDFLTAQKMASVLGVSAAFLYAPEDDVAELIFRFSKATEEKRALVREALQNVMLPPAN
ncbi:MAG: helix-turn-helix domain-containing protein [Janthinobacterium lividum]